LMAFFVAPLPVTTYRMMVGGLSGENTLWPKTT
jgi:hypothetical protein